MSADSLVVPPRFVDAILLHLARCYAMDAKLGSGQILAVVGAPGTGKTFQLTHTLSMSQVACVHFGAIEVENPSANEPLRILRSRVEQVRGNLDNGIPSALVIDDVDLLLGRRELTQYTHNLQRVVAELMKVANAISIEDGPNSVATPIFMLANQLDVLHGPLLRFGRARVFEWEPSDEELLPVLASIFYELLSEDIVRLRTEFTGQHVAFFSTLRDALLDTYLLQLIRSRPPRESLDYLLAQRGSLRPTLRYSVDNAIAAGKSLLNQRVTGSLRSEITH